MAFLRGQSEKDAAQAMQDAINEASGQISEGFGQAIGYLQPFYDTGVQALTDYSSTLSNWLSNPIDTYNAIMGQWSGSPAYQMQTQAMIDASNAAAAASGELGGGAQQTALQQQAQQLATADQQQFFNNITGLGKGYLTGEQNLYKTGLNAGTQMGNWSSQEAEDLASLSTAMGKAKGQEAMAGYHLGDAFSMFAPNIMGATKQALYGGGYLTPPNRYYTPQSSATKGAIYGFLGGY